MSKFEGTSWAVDGDGDFRPIAKAQETIPPGFYSVVQNAGGLYMRPREVISDDLILLSGNVAMETMKDFEHFWKIRDRFKSRGLLHKRGILLWGPPGTGKTASIMLMADALIKNYNGIVLQITDPNWGSAGLKMIRSVEPDRPIVVIMEDFDSLVRRYEEDDFLALLDGENQIDRVVYIATTNYPEHLDMRFTDRPSRFDIIRRVGFPPAEARRQFLLNRDSTIKNVDEWVEHTDEFSIAHLREMIILVQCFEVPVKEAANRIRNMRNPEWDMENDSENPGIVNPVVAVKKKKR